MAIQGAGVQRLPGARSCAALLAAALLLGADLLPAQPRAEPGFTTAATERLIQAYERRFGSPARSRIEAWKRFAAGQAHEAERARLLLDAVNAFVNRLRFVEDQAHWGEADYWATPAESVGSGGADCEDYAIAKYFLLKQLGVPVTSLRLVYVRALRLNQAHMVLAYYPRPDADPLVLDNLEAQARPASQRADLEPVYSFNDEAVWIETRGRVGAPQQIRNWAALLQRLQREFAAAGLGAASGGGAT